MSFGFGVGDFLAVGELSWKLYRSVYQVARDAPPEIEALKQELSNLHNIISALKEDASQSDSAVAQAPENRVELGRNLLKATEGNLKGLEKLVDKYLPLGQPIVDPKSRREAIKRLLKKIQYTGIVGEINDFRAKIHYNTGLLNLLLIAAGNSSLQRIQEQNAKLSRNVEAIKASMHSPSQTQKNPTLTCSYDEQSQYELTRAFMAQAEVKGMHWAAVGIESWIQVGKWWLMKAQAGLNGSVEGQYQAYADLLKASWILTDVISTHPQLSFLSSGQQQLDIEHLSQVVKLEHERVASSSFRRPSLDRIMESDLTVWEIDPKTNLLPPMSRAQGHDSTIWKSDSGNVLFQRFGRYVMPPTNIEVECVILLVDKPGEPLTIIGQSVHGNDIVVVGNHDAPTSLNDDSTGYSLVIDHYYEKYTFRFLNWIDARLLFLLIDGINRFRCFYGVEALSVRTLRAVALLQCLAHHRDVSDLPRDDAQEDIRLLAHLEETDTGESKNPGDLWNLAFATANDPAPPAVRYLPRIPYGERLQARVLSWILWANAPISTRFAVLDTVLPQWQLKYMGEAHQAAIISEDLELLEAVASSTIPSPDGTSLGTVDSIEAILIGHASHFFESTGKSFILFWASVRLQSSNLLTIARKLCGHEQSWGQFSDMCDTIGESKNTAACKFFLQHFKPSEITKYEVHALWNMVQKLCYSSGIKNVPLESDHWKECHGRNRLIPAVIGGDVAFVEALQQHIGSFAVNIDPIKFTTKNVEPNFNVAYEVNGYIFDSEHHRDWHPRETMQNIIGWDEVEWPYWPLSIAIRLGHGIELIAHLVSSGALLWHKSHSQTGEPAILGLVRGYQTLDDAREAYYNFHAQLRCTLSRISNECDSFWAEEYEWAQVSVCAEMINSGVPYRPYADSPTVYGSEEYFPDLPVSLQTESNFDTWKGRLVPLLEEATAVQLGSPLSE